MCKMLWKQHKSLLIGAMRCCYIQRNSTFEFLVLKPLFRLQECGNSNIHRVLPAFPRSLTADFIRKPHTSRYFQNRILSYKKPHFWYLHLASYLKAMLLTLFNWNKTPDSLKYILLKKQTKKQHVHKSDAKYFILPQKTG